MAQESSLLPKMEVLIIIIFFIGFAVWTFDKCGETKRTYQQQTSSETNAVDEIMNRNAGAIDLSAADSLPTSSNASPSVPRPQSSRATQQRYTPLYVTIDGLNLRDQPNLTGKILTRLNLYEEVAFLNEVTDSTQQINLGKITPDEPWVKVNGRGHVGWVYGAGVEYYKTKLEGVE